jgi:hypothetical protein
MDFGTEGGIAGGVIGVMGGVSGANCSIRNTSRPRERALMIRMAVLCWLWIAALTALQFLMPSLWRHGAFLLVFTPLLSIPWLNRKLASARAKDEAIHPKEPIAELV